MVKVQAPALSMEASGKLGGCMVFSSWKGRAYVRSLVKPTNPQTALQTGIRAAMKFLAQIWASQTAEAKAAWATLAANANISPFNAFVQENMQNWRNGYGPCITPAAGHETGGCVVSALGPVGGPRHVTIAYQAAAWSTEFALVLCRSLVEVFTPTWANCIAVLPLTDAAQHYFIDSALDPGTYWYRAATVSNDGLQGTFIAAADAIVT